MDDDQYNSNNENNNNNNSDDEICKVYDKEDLFTVSVQIVLALMALLSLWFKRQQERPRRTFSTWCLDISKQAIGACYAHVLNMVRFCLGCVGVGVGAATTVGCGGDGCHFVPF